MTLNDNRDVETIRRQLLHSKGVYEGVKRATLSKYCEAFSKIAAVLTDDEFDAVIRYHSAEGSLLTIAGVLGLC